MAKKGIPINDYDQYKVIDQDGKLIANFRSRRAAMDWIIKYDHYDQFKIEGVITKK